jgi:hypothetical protein
LPTPQAGEEKEVLKTLCSYLIVDGSKTPQAGEEKEVLKTCALKCCSKARALGETAGTKLFGD